MKTYKLPSGLASATNQVSGGYSIEVTLPMKAKDRNKALLEAMEELLKMSQKLDKLNTVLSASINALENEE